jgi:hypothetical protein
MVAATWWRRAGAPTYASQTWSTANASESWAPRALTGDLLVGLAGIEPATSALSGRSAGSRCVPEGPAQSQSVLVTGQAKYRTGIHWDAAGRSGTQLLGQSWDRSRARRPIQFPVSRGRRRRLPLPGPQGWEIEEPGPRHRMITSGHAVSAGRTSVESGLQAGPTPIDSTKVPLRTAALSITSEP